MVKNYIDRNITESQFSKRPDPLGELERSPRPPSRKRGPTSKGRGKEGRGGEGGEGRRGKGGWEGEERGGKGRGGEGREVKGEPTLRKNLATGLMCINNNTPTDASIQGLQ